MSAKRPTESAWDTDEEDLLDDTTGLNALSSEKDGEIDEEIDEDELLASDEEEEEAEAEVEVVGLYAHGEDGSVTNISDLQDDNYVELFVADEIDQQDIDEDVEPEDRPQEVVQSAEDTNTNIDQYTDTKYTQEHAEGDIKESAQNTSQLTETSFDTTQSPPQTMSDDESEDEEDSDKNTRDRFKSERINVITSITGKKSRSNTEIPDTLEISEEDENRIKSYLPGQRGGRGRHTGPQRGKFQPRQQQPNQWDRGNMRTHGFRGLPMQHNRIAHSQGINFNNNAMHMGPSPSLMGIPVVRPPQPHMQPRGTMPNTSWAPTTTFSEPLLHTPVANQRFNQPLGQFRGPGPLLQHQPGRQPAQPTVLSQAPRHVLIRETVKQQPPAQPSPVDVGWSSSRHPNPSPRYQSMDHQATFRSQHPTSSHHLQGAPAYTHAGQPRPEFQASPPRLPYQSRGGPQIPQPLLGQAPPRTHIRPQGGRFPEPAHTLDQDERIRQPAPASQFQAPHTNNTPYNAPGQHQAHHHQGMRLNSLPQPHHPQPNSQPLPRHGLDQTDFFHNQGKFGPNPGELNRQPEHFRPPWQQFGGSRPQSPLPSLPQPFQQPIGQPIQTVVKRSPGRAGQPPVYNRLGNTNMPPNKPPAVKKPEVKKLPTKEELEQQKKLQSRAMRFSGKKEVSVVPQSTKVKLGEKRSSPLAGSIVIKAKQPRLEPKTQARPGANKLSTATKAANLRLAKARSQLQKVAAQQKPPGQVVGSNTASKPVSSAPVAAPETPAVKMTIDIDDEYARKLEEQKRKREELLAQKRRNRLAQVVQHSTQGDGINTSENPLSQETAKVESTASSATPGTITSMAPQTNSGHHFQQQGRGVVVGGRGMSRGTTRGTQRGMTRGTSRGVPRGVPRGRGMRGRGRGLPPAGQNPSVLRQVSLDTSGPEVQDNQSRRQVTPPIIPTGGRRVVQNIASGATAPRIVQPPSSASRQVIPAGGIAPDITTPRTNPGSRRIVMGHTPQAPMGNPVLRQVQLDGVATTTDSSKFMQLAQRFGPVQSVTLVPCEKKAIVLFQHPKDAATFAAKYNRIMVDMAIITARLI